MQELLQSYLKLSFFNNSALAFVQFTESFNPIRYTVSCVLMMSQLIDSMILSAGSAWYC